MQKLIKRFGSDLMCNMLHIEPNLLSIVPETWPRPAQERGLFFLEISRYIWSRSPLHGDRTVASWMSKPRAELDGLSVTEVFCSKQNWTPNNPLIYRIRILATPGLE